ncbi:unnamed protein product, partial [Amoebophrya sp. A120]|eukprot:GSA120T00021779001.1
MRSSYSSSSAAGAEQFPPGKIAHGLAPSTSQEPRRGGREARTDSQLFAREEALLLREKYHDQQQQVVLSAIATPPSSATFAARGAGPSFQLKHSRDKLLSTCWEEDLLIDHSLQKRRELNDPTRSAYRTSYFSSKLQKFLADNASDEDGERVDHEVDDHDWNKLDYHQDVDQTHEQHVSLAQQSAYFAKRSAGKIARRTEGQLALAGHQHVAAGRRFHYRMEPTKSGGYTAYERTQEDHQRVLPHDLHHQGTTTKQDAVDHDVVTDVEPEAIAVLEELLKYRQGGTERMNFAGAPAEGSSMGNFYAKDGQTVTRQKRLAIHARNNKQVDQRQTTFSRQEQQQPLYLGPQPKQGMLSSVESTPSKRTEASNMTPSSALTSERNLTFSVGGTSSLQVSRAKLQLRAKEREDLDVVNDFLNRTGDENFHFLRQEQDDNSPYVGPFSRMNAGDRISSGNMTSNPSSLSATPDILRSKNTTRGRAQMNFVAAEGGADETRHPVVHQPPQQLFYAEPASTSMFECMPNHREDFLTRTACSATPPPPPGRVANRLSKSSNILKNAKADHRRTSKFEEHLKNNSHWWQDSALVGKYTRVANRFFLLNRAPRILHRWRFYVSRKEQLCEDENEVDDLEHTNVAESTALRPFDATSERHSHRVINEAHYEHEDAQTALLKTAGDHDLTSTAFGLQTAFGVLDSSTKISSWLLHLDRAEEQAAIATSGRQYRAKWRPFCTAVVRFVNRHFRKHGLESWKSGRVVQRESAKKMTCLLNLLKQKMHTELAWGFRVRKLAMLAVTGLRENAVERRGRKTTSERNVVLVQIGETTKAEVDNDENSRTSSPQLTSSSFDSDGSSSCIPSGPESDEDLAFSPLVGHKEAGSKSSAAPGRADERLLESGTAHPQDYNDGEDNAVKIETILSQYNPFQTTKTAKKKIDEIRRKKRKTSGERKQRRRSKSSKSKNTSQEDELQPASKGNKTFGPRPFLPSSPPLTETDRVKDQQRRAFFRWRRGTIGVEALSLSAWRWVVRTEKVASLLRWKTLNHVARMRSLFVLLRKGFLSWKLAHMLFIEQGGVSTPLMLSSSSSAASSIAEGGFSPLLACSSPPEAGKLALLRPSRSEKQSLQENWSRMNTRSGRPHQEALHGELLFNRPASSYNRVPLAKRMLKKAVLKWRSGMRFGLLPEISVFHAEMVGLEEDAEKKVERHAKRLRNLLNLRKELADGRDEVLSSMRQASNSTVGSIYFRRNVPSKGVPPPTSQQFLFSSDYFASGERKELVPTQSIQAGSSSAASKESAIGVSHEAVGGARKRSPNYHAEEVTGPAGAALPRKASSSLSTRTASSRSSRNTREQKKLHLTDLVRTATGVVEDVVSVSARSEDTTDAGVGHVVGMDSGAAAAGDEHTLISATAATGADRQIKTSTYIDLLDPNLQARVEAEHEKKLLKQPKKKKPLLAKRYAKEQQALLVQKINEELQASHQSQPLKHATERRALLKRASDTRRRRDHDDRNLNAKSNAEGFHPVEDGTEEDDALREQDVILDIGIAGNKHLEPSSAQLYAALDMLENASQDIQTLRKGYKKQMSKDILLRDIDNGNDPLSMAELLRSQMRDEEQEQRAELEQEQRAQPERATDSELIFGKIRKISSSLPSSQQRQISRTTDPDGVVLLGGRERTSTSASQSLGAVADLRARQELQNNYADDEMTMTKFFGHENHASLFQRRDEGKERAVSNSIGNKQDDFYAGDDDVLPKKREREQHRVAGREQMKVVKTAPASGRNAAPGTGNKNGAQSSKVKKNGFRRNHFAAFDEDDYATALKHMTYLEQRRAIRNVTQRDHASSSTIVPKKISVEEY